MDEMAGMALQAVVQEGVSGGLSFVLGRRKEMAPEADNMERLEIAHTELELAMERSSKFPITDRSLLRRRKILKRAFEECGDVLYRSKLRALEDDEIEPRDETVTHSPFPKRIARAVKSWVAYLLTSTRDGLSCSDVRRFERLSDYASKFVRDVESGCTLRHYTFCNPLVRHLLQGQTLKHEMEQGGKFRYFHLWPTCFQERGVEAQLKYLCVDHKTMEKSFDVELMLRLSENTDIVGIATKCLQSLTSLFNLVAETATGEITLLANLNDMSHSYAPPEVGVQDLHTEYTHFWRPDPVCCKENGHGPSTNNIAPSELSHRFPEQVIHFSLTCSVSALKFSLLSSPDEAGSCIMRDRMPPLEVTAGFLPHIVHEQQETYAIEIVGDNEERIDVSIEQVAETARSNAINCFLIKPKLTYYGMLWRSKHGGAGFMIKNRSTERAGAPTTNYCIYKAQSSAKGRR